MKINDTNIQDKKETKNLSLQVKACKTISITKFLEELYRSTVEPHVRYCSSIWGCCSTTDIDTLQKLQNRAFRIITNNAFDAPATLILANPSLTSFSELSENDLKLITFTSLNDLAPDYLKQLLIRNSQQSYRALRNTDMDLKLPLKETNNGQKGYFIGAKSWNSPSAGAKRAPSLAPFKAYLYTVALYI